MASRETDRTERVRQVVNGVLREQTDEELRLFGFVHLHGVSQFCAMLALQRGLDAELGTIAGMLHDIWTVRTGERAEHGERGTPLARSIMSKLGCFTESEIETVCGAICHHLWRGRSSLSARSARQRGLSG